MCDNSCSNKTCNCVGEVLKVICILQNEVCPGTSCLETCTKAYFGPSESTEFNTRPVTLYTCNGTKLEMPISNLPGEATKSDVFRVEKINDCCATLRVLSYDSGTPKYTSTNSFFTIDTNCLCAIKCLGDTYVDCI